MNPSIALPLPFQFRLPRALSVALALAALVALTLFESLLAAPLFFVGAGNPISGWIAATIAHTTTIRNQLCDLVVDAVDGGTTDSSGDIAIYTASFATLLCTINFAAPPAFGAASNGAASATSLPRTGTAVASGTAAVFRMRNRDNTELLNGSVGTSGQDMNLSSTTIATNDEISLNTITYTAAP